MKKIILSLVLFLSFAGPVEGGEMRTEPQFEFELTTSILIQLESVCMTAVLTPQDQRQRIAPIIAGLLSQQHFHLMDELLPIVQETFDTASDFRTTIKGDQASLEQGMKDLWVSCVQRSRQKARTVRPFAPA